MPIVNYVREHIRFIEYATDEHLTSSERLLWYALMHIMNQRAQGKVWPEEFIRISNDRLLSYCPMKYDTIVAARNSLKQRGLIDFVKGDRNKQSPGYKMIYFYPEYIAPENTDQPQSYSEKSDNLGSNMGGNIGGNIGGNMGGNMGYFNINLNNKTKQNENLSDDDEEDEEAFQRARAEAETAWKSAFGKSPTPQMLHELAWRCQQLGFEEGVLTRAIKLAAIKGASSPVEYVSTVLVDWSRQKVRTLADAEEYGFIYDAMNGKIPEVASVTEGVDALEQFRRKREKGDKAI